ncbi:hypothetical protein ALC57_16710, partial [Trachymyrmex cornetzi]
SLITTNMESLSAMLSYVEGILVTIGCKIVEVTVDTTLVGRSSVSVTVSTVVVVIVCVSKSVLVVGGEPNTDVLVLVTVEVLNLVT